MLAGAKREMVLRGGRRDKGVGDPQAGGEAEFLHIDRSSMADVFGQGEDLNRAFLEEVREEVPLVRSPVKGRLLAAFHACP